MNYKEALRQQFRHRNYIYKETMPSTSDFLWECYDAGEVIDESIAICDVQTAGRGRRARNWDIESGRAVLISFGKNIESEAITRMPLIIPVAVHVVLNRYSQNGPLKIKWPNDIWLGVKKVAGILIDTRIRNNSAVAVIGVGVNITHALDDERAGLMDETSDWLRASIARDLVDEIISSLQSDSNIQQWVNRYNDSLLWRGEAVKERDGEVLGCSLGVDEKGQLLVERGSEIMAFNESDKRIVSVL